MTYYIALIHKDQDSCYGVSFPDIPGVFTAGDTFEEAMAEAADVLNFAAEDWTNPDGTTEFRKPRSIEELRQDPDFVELSQGAFIVMVDYSPRAHAAE
jgi:predicted RNase H-like HicB family nuclease